MEDIEEVLTFALEMRRRVKEQLKKIGGMEFYDVNFSYIDNESFEERYVSVPEQWGRGCKIFCVNSQSHYGSTKLGGRIEWLWFPRSS